MVGHNGIDYGLPEGTSVLAAAGGKVIQAGEKPDFGNLVIIQHRWGQSWYGHLREVRKSVGDRVKAGSLIGLSGNSGFTFGRPHLHFAVKPNDSNVTNGYLGFIDPGQYFRQSKRKIPTTGAERKNS